MAITHSIKFTASAKDALSEIEKYENRIVATAQTVDKYASALGGGKILAQANNWVAAVEKIGGATRLTGVEQEKVNRILEQAIAKYTALGQTAPTAMTELYEATKHTATATAEAQTGAGGLMSKLGPLGPMIATTFTVGAVVGFARELLATGDQLQKMADRTGMTAEQVQRLQYVADQTGVSLDSMVGAVQNLQQRLGSGDAGAVGALKQLGIEQQRFMALDPYQQFTELATAIGNITDPTQQAALAAEVFGKTWKDLIPAVRADIKGLADDAPVMANATVSALDRLGDAFSRLKTMAKVAAAEVTVGFVDMAGAFLQSGLGGMLAAGTARALAVPSLTKDRELKTVIPTVTDYTVTVRANDAATRKAADAQMVYSTALSSVAIGAASAVPKIGALNGQLVGLGQATKSALPWLGWEGQNANGTLLSQPLDVMIAKLPAVTNGMTDVGQATEDTSKKTMQWSSVAQMALGAVAAAGNKTASTLAGIGTSILGGFQAGGVWGAVAGGALSVFSAIGNAIFKTENKKVNDLRDAYIAAAGGLHQLNVAAHDAGLTLDRLQGAKTIKAYEAAVNELNAALAKTAAIQSEIKGLQQQLADRQVMDWQKAEEIIQKYGGTLASLGRQFVLAKEQATWTDVWNDWERVIDMGGDVGGVLYAMREEISALVLSAQQFGTEIPAQFQPLVEELIRSGNLIDANGNAITDLSGIKFGAPLVSEVDRIIDAIEKLVDTLNGKLTPAIHNIPETVRVKVGYEVEDFPDLPGREVPVPGFARGTQGRYLDFGAGTLAMLHGRERVVTEAESRRAPAGPATIVVPVTIDGREVARVTARYLPRQLALAGL